MTAWDTDTLGDAAVDLTEQLVRLDTVNPGLVAGAPGERAAVELLAARLEIAGFRCDVIAPQTHPDRPSLVARHIGEGSGSGARERRKSLLLNGHLDTVGVGAMPDPFAARIVGGRSTGRLEGRGSCDMKAGVAGMVVAAEAVAAAGVPGDIVLALVADEEHASLGSDAVIDWLRGRGELPTACVVGEPTWLDLALAHRGFAVVEVELRGKAAHSSQPGEGVNAVAHLGRLLAAVERYDHELAARPAHPHAGRGSMLVTMASGGTAPFSIPNSARAVVERRTVPGERAAEALAEVERLVAALWARDASVDATCRLSLAREAWQVDGSAESTELSGLLSAGLTAAGCAVPQCFGAPYWMESALWQAAGVPTLVCGPAGGGLHADDEWVDLRQVRAYPGALASAAAAFLRRPEMIGR
ncbi:MAG: M20/M25/M40 family metallo-hydrolase [Actinomycetota bacterium]|nr:M20/M25/M40 family metallo-hydrolase [Actinomycetota bacterium]